VRPGRSRTRVDLRRHGHTTELAKPVQPRRSGYLVGPLDLVVPSNGPLCDRQSDIPLLVREAPRRCLDRKRLFGVELHLDRRPTRLPQRNLDAFVSIAVHIRMMSMLYGPP
jgi:hypothetical protein